MKTFFTLLVALVCASPLWAQNKSFKQLVGKWEAVDSENQSGGLEIIDSVQIFLVYGTERKAVASCQFDFAKSPCWFDFSIKDSSGTMNLKSILLFVNDDLIQWQVFEGETRPTQFSSDTGEMVYLRRKK
jgi:hypothetical protein